MQSNLIIVQHQIHALASMPNDTLVGENLAFFHRNALSERSTNYILSEYTMEDFGFCSVQKGTYGIIEHLGHSSKIYLVIQLEDSEYSWISKVFVINARLLFQDIYYTVCKHIYLHIHNIFPWRFLFCPKRFCIHKGKFVPNIPSCNICRNNIYGKEWMTRKKNNNRQCIRHDMKENQT